MKTKVQKGYPECLASGAKKQLVLDIEAIMDSEKMSEAVLASKIGMTVAKVRHILSGKSHIYLEDVDKISKALGKRMTVIMR